MQILRALAFNKNKMKLISSRSGALQRKRDWRGTQTPVRPTKCLPRWRVNRCNISSWYTLRFAPARAWVSLPRSTGRTVDFDKRKIKISKALQYVKGLGIFEKCPKTERSHRTVTIPKSVVGLLLRHRRKQIEDRLKCGEKWADTGKVFTKWNDEFVYINSLGDWLGTMSSKKAEKQAEPG